MRQRPEFRVGNVKIRPYAGWCVELTVMVDDVPAVALLERGEVKMLASALQAMACASGSDELGRFNAALAELLGGGGESGGQPAYVTN